MAHRHPRRRPGWWPDDETWPPERWPADLIMDGRRGDGRQPGRAGGTWGGAFVVGLIARTVGFTLLAILLVTLLGYVGAAVVGVATAPLPVLAVGVLALVGLAAGVPLAWRAFRRAGLPLERLVEAAGQVEAGDYSTRVSEDGPGDLRSLARAFNQMSARLEEGDQARRGFLADVSHELRTPLTVIRGQLEAIGDGIYPADPAHLAPVLAQTALLERLVEDLRTVALAESGALGVRQEPLELSAVAADVLAGFAPRADEAGVTLELDADPAPPIAGDAAHLRRILANLVTNALRHTPPGGTVRVGVAVIDGGWQRLTVRDSGSGIPEEILPRVFERFVRGPGSDGSGLGLAIASDLVAAHGGRIWVEQPTGGGTCLVVELPPGLGTA